MDSVGFYWVLLGFSGFCPGLIGFLLGSNGFDRVSVDSVCILLGSSEF